MAARILRIAIAALALVLVAFAGSAQAGPITELELLDCDAYGCEGSTLKLTVEENNDGSFTVTYTINTDNYYGDTNNIYLTGINQVGFKVIKDWDTGYVVSSPVGSMSNTYDPNLSPWNPIFDSPIASNSLCETSNGDTDMVCVAGFVDIGAGGDYTWVFHIDQGTLMDVEDWHLGAQYAAGYLRSHGHIISTKPVPEPTAMALFGLGAILVARSVRRRR